MYPKYFGLKEPSFSITPDPQYLFLSGQHREALAHLLYGAGGGGGFVLLTGEVGTGKTTVCRAFLEQLPEGLDVALVLNPAMTATELLHAICDEFGVELPTGEPSVKTMLDHLNRFLLDAHARGRRPVLIIDEAQNLRPKVLEQIRLLTNLETSKQKLLQIFLIGQPELRTLLATPDLRQLNQRVTARYHLTPLGVKETAAYVEHRIAVAGVDRPLFTPRALKRVHQHTRGVPRLINLLCDRALLGAAVSRRMQVTPAVVDTAAREVINRADPALPRRRGALGLAAAITGALGLGLWLGASGLPQRLPALWSATAPAEWLSSMGWSRTAQDSGDKTGLAPSPRADAPAVAESGAEVTPVPEAPLNIAQATLADPPAAESPEPGALPADVSVQAAVTDQTDADTGLASVAEAAEDQPATATATATAAAGASLTPDAVGDSAQHDTDTPPELAASQQTHASDAVDADTAQPAPPAADGVIADRRLADAQSPTADTHPPRIATARVAPRVSVLDAARLGDALVSEDAVVDELLGLWQVQKAPGVRFLDCAAVPAFALACERSTGRWSELRRFDRPAALKLRLPGNETGFVVVGGLDDEHALLYQNGVAMRVPIAVLDERWSGDYLLLWRPPPFGGRVIADGDPADAIGWLRERLALLPGSELTVDPARYDTDVKAAVRGFQVTQGLVPDGIAGPRTLIMLSNVLADLDVPRLSQSR
ncbi:MAG: AAA family ATPase [Thiohalocapsa sp.]